LSSSIPLTLWWKRESRHGFACPESKVDTSRLLFSQANADKEVAAGRLWSRDSIPYEGHARDSTCNDDSCFDHRVDCAFAGVALSSVVLLSDGQEYDATETGCGGVSAILMLLLVVSPHRKAAAVGRWKASGSTSSYETTREL
jgi:hypothetical protein